MKNNVNENRKNFVKLTALYNINNKIFSVDNGKVSMSMENSLLENANDPIEQFEDNYETFDEMFNYAKEKSYENVSVSIEHFHGVPFFKLFNYVIYLYDHKIYYRDEESFFMICDALDNKLIIKAMLKYDIKSNIELDYIEENDSESALDLIDTIIISKSGMNENIKIRKPSLSSKGDKNNSKLYDEALYGTKDNKDFEEKVEKETLIAKVDNPLAPIQLQQESVVNILPNAHSLQESKTEVNNMKIEYQLGDWVIIKETGMKAQVNNICINGDGKLTMMTIIASNGIAYDVDDLSEITPDPLYLENIPGRMINSLNLQAPSTFDIDPETKLERTPLNEKLPDDWHKDLNGRDVIVYILKDGRRVSTNPYIANLDDIAASKKNIRVMDEAEDVQEYDVNKDIEFLEMPYAAVVDSDDKPVRSILIDPTSYINAEEDENVICKVDGKLTKFPKSRIKLLS